MYLKNLTLRGFKSFASATTLRFEPGITCVVGPNGSGKSNVVDALSWVMGEQGAKSLRGGKMEDVIFAGTSTRQELGRAEVSLTIDNTDGALPIDYTEVTIKRTMFRNGGSEYALNGDTCRLLDIQELLSDSGIGREMHVVVGQGQLDTVLHAGPEERRSLIEEAAGILKHRKRKEKAIRKLQAMQGNLDRVTDLTAELRRQLKPLGRQAELARKAAVIQADVRDARLRLLADDIVTLTDRLAKEEADEKQILERRTATEKALHQAQERETTLETQATTAAPALAAANETYHTLSRLTERLNTVRELAGERHRNLISVSEEPIRQRDPEELEMEAEEAAAQEEELQTRLEEARELLDTTVEERSTAEDALHREEKRLEAVHRATAERREGLVRMAARVESLRGRLSSGDTEITRLREAADQAATRAQQARAEYEIAAEESAGLDEDDAEDVLTQDEAAERLSAIETELQRLRDVERNAEGERAALAARKETLEMGLAGKDGADTLLRADLDGMLGSLPALVQVETGYETAVAAAFGRAAGAVAASDPDTAVAALDLLRSENAGRAGIVVAGAGPFLDRSAWPPLPDGARYLVDVVVAPEHLRGSVTALLERTALVTDAEAARDLVTKLPHTCAVTPEGDVFSAELVHGGSAAAPSLLEVQAAVDEAGEQLEAAVETAREAARELETAERDRAELAETVERLTARRRQGERKRNESAQRLGTLGGQVRSAEAEAERYTAAAHKAEASRAEDATKLQALEAELTEAEEMAASIEEEAPDPEVRDELAARVSSAAPPRWNADCRYVPPRNGPGPSPDVPNNSWPRPRRNAERWNVPQNGAASARGRPPSPSPSPRAHAWPWNASAVPMPWPRASGSPRRPPRRNVRPNSRRCVPASGSCRWSWKSSPVPRTAVRWPVPSGVCAWNSWRPRRWRNSVWTCPRSWPSTGHAFRCHRPPTPGRTRRPSRTCGRCRPSASRRQNANSTNSARSTPLPWRSSPPWRNVTPSSTRSWRI